MSREFVPDLARLGRGEFLRRHRVGGRLQVGQPAAADRPLPGAGPQRVGVVVGTGARASRPLAGTALGRGRGTRLARRRGGASVSTGETSAARAAAATVAASAASAGSAVGELGDHRPARRPGGPAARRARGRPPPRPAPPRPPHRVSVGSRRGGLRGRVGLARQVAGPQRVEHVAAAGSPGTSGGSTSATCATTCAAVSIRRRSASTSLPRLAASLGQPLLDVAEPVGARTAARAASRGPPSPRGGTVRTRPAGAGRPGRTGPTTCRAGRRSPGPPRPHGSRRPSRPPLVHSSSSTAACSIVSPVPRFFGRDCSGDRVTRMRRPPSVASSRTSVRAVVPAWSQRSRRAVARWPGTTP